MNAKSIQEMQKIYEGILQKSIMGIPIEEMVEELGIEKESIELILASPIMQSKIESEKRKIETNKKEIQKLENDFQNVDEHPMPEIDALTLLEKSQRDAVKTLVMEMKMADKSQDRIRAAQTLLELHRKANANETNASPVMDTNQISTLRNLMVEYKEFHAKHKILEMPQLKLPSPEIEIKEGEEESKQLPQSI